MLHCISSSPVGQDNNPFKLDLAPDELLGERLRSPERDSEGEMEELKKKRLRRIVPPSLSRFVK